MTSADERSAPDDAGGVRRLARGSGVGVVGSALSQGCLFAVVVLLAARLGASGVGIYSQAFAILTLLSLLALGGMQTTLTRYVAQHLAVGENAQVRLIVVRGIAATTASSLLFAGGIYAVAPWLSGSVMNEPDLLTPLRIVAFAIPGAVFAKSAAAVLQGFGRMRDYVTATLIMEPLLRLALTAVLLALGFGLPGAVVALAMSNTTAALWAGSRVARLLPRERSSHPYPWREVGRFTALTWVATMSTNALLWGDTLVLGAFADSATVGIYQVATRIVSLATLAAVPIASAFAPVIAGYSRRKQWALMDETYKLTTAWSTRISLPALAVCLALPSQALSIFGSDFAAGALVTVVLVVGKAVDAMTGPCGMVLNMSSRVGLNAANNVAALALNMSLNLLLIPPFGMVGAAVAWSVSLVVLNLARVLEVKRVLGLSPWSRALPAAALAVVPGSVAAAIVGRYLTGDMAGLMLGVPLVVLPYLVVVRRLHWRQADDVVLRSLVPHAASRLVRTPTARHRKRASLPVDDRRAVPIVDLVSPLRLDICIRADFFRFIEAHLELYERDRASFYRLARDHEYYAWYRGIAYPLARGSRVPRSPDRAFVRRVDQSIALYQQFQCVGFDEDFPVTLWRPTRVLPTHSGKLVVRDLYVGDGCHRLALLVNAGHDVLTPNMYRVRAAGEFTPLDNTSKSLRLTSWSERRYAAFLAWGYGLAPGVESEPSISSVMKAMPPDRLDEVLSVLEVDHQLLEDVSAADPQRLRRPTLPDHVSPMPEHAP